MSEIVQVLSNILKMTEIRKRRMQSMSSKEEALTIKLTRDLTATEFQKKVAVDITAQSYEV